MDQFIQLMLLNFLIPVIFNVYMRCNMITLYGHMHTTHAFTNLMNLNLFHLNNVFPLVMIY